MEHMRHTSGHGVSTHQYQLVVKLQLIVGN